MNRAQTILKILKELYPEAHCELNHASAWQLLMATILSAQCTDKRVNMVTAEIFAKYPTVEDINKLDLDHLKQLIKSTGFYNNKAINIKKAAKLIVEKFAGKVPDNMQDLLEIPGVARKTANVVLSVWYKKNEGVVVDTHVTRLVQRFELSKNTDPKKIEQDLMQLYDREDWERVGTLLVHHGRYVCTAKNPKCQESPLYEYCTNCVCHK